MSLVIHKGWILIQMDDCSKSGKALRSPLHVSGSLSSQDLHLLFPVYRVQRTAQSEQKSSRKREKSEKSVREEEEREDPGSISRLT